MEAKDPSKKHFYISLVKSGIRIVAGASLIYGNIILAGGLLVIAEVLGIGPSLVRRLHIRLAKLEQSILSRPSGQAKGKSQGCCYVAFALP